MASCLGFSSHSERVGCWWGRLVVGGAVGKLSILCRSWWIRAQHRARRPAGGRLLGALTALAPCGRTGTGRIFFFFKTTVRVAGLRRF